MTAAPLTHALKEWAPLVADLASGQHILLLRKGGIAEGKDGFTPGPTDRSFWLLGTEFHAAPDKLTPSAAARWHAHPQPVSLLSGPTHGLRLRHAAQLVEQQFISDETLLPALTPFHGCHPAVIQERFHYGKQPGLWLLLLRVYQLPPAQPPHTAPWHPRYDGCRSWVELDPTATASPDLLQPVLTHAEFKRERGAILALIQ